MSMTRPTTRGRRTLPAPLPTARRFAGAAVVDNTIYTVGGEALVATVGQPFTYQITATNKPTSYEASPLPEGVKIDTERGIIFGTPMTSAQGFVVTFTATNQFGSDSKDVSLYIAPPPSLPEESIVSSTCATGRAGQPFAFQVLTNYASTEAKLAATGLPYETDVNGEPRMTIDPGTGLISGIVSPRVGWIHPKALGCN